jgi:glycosyltransferase involved in cell wall biosynthesis
LPYPERRWEISINTDNLIAAEGKGSSDRTGDSPIRVIVCASAIVVTSGVPSVTLLKDITSIEFSIVVPLYNKAPEIARCLRSALSQTTTNFELIVIDDGSTDGGDAVVRSFQDSRVRFLQQENQGVARTRNHGVQVARSSIIAFLDADDEWLPNHLEEVARLVKLHPNAGLFLTGFWLDRGGGWRRSIRLAKKYMKPGSCLVADYFSVPDGKITLPSASAFMRDALIAAGGFRTMFGEDVDLWLRMAAMFPTAYSSEPTAIWHLDVKNRRCIEEASNGELHQPNSLLPSLHVVESLDRIPAETKFKARDYVARREQRAILDTMQRGQREHAVYLYERWQEEYKKESIETALLLKLPSMAPKLFGRCGDFLRRAKSTAHYVIEQPKSVKLFGY